MFSKHPFTHEQFQQMVRDLSEMKIRAEEMVQFTRNGLGPSDQRTIRAEELNAAIQRMQWAIERQAWAASAG